MLETALIFLYTSGIAVTALAIYGTIDNAHPVKALIAILLWPFIPVVAIGIVCWEYVFDKFR